MIWNDEIVEEVRQARDEYAAQFDYDISAICAAVRRRQKEDGRKVIASLKEEEREKDDLPKAA